MNLGLTGKVVFITGGSKGIGLASARAFAVEGARVAIASRSDENLDRARQAFEKEGLTITAFRADLSNLQGRNSPPDTGGVAAASMKCREATLAPQTAWSVRHGCFG